MVKILWEPGRTFGEFSLLPNHKTDENDLSTVSLETRLADNLVLGVPFLSAAMGSVTGYDMCLALGKAKGRGVIPVGMPLEKKLQILDNLSETDLTFVENPITLLNTKTVEGAIREVEKRGYSTIPVVDKFQKFLGMFTMEHYWGLDVHPDAPVTEAMIPYKGPGIGIDVCLNPEITISEVKTELGKIKGRYMVVMDDLQRLVKMAFRQDMDKLSAGVAITVSKGWQDIVESCTKAGADFFSLDTSDADGDFACNFIKEYKRMNNGVPLCAGNVVTYAAAMHLMEAGADMIKVGMSSGSICTTQREKATGRAPMTALLEVAKARKDYFEKTGKYVSIIIDGGVATSADMVVALTLADAVMCGNYFNKFYEAAGQKLDKNFKPTTDESKMTWVETWGEGSEKARSLNRYAHKSRKTFFAEGVEDVVVQFAGRLKPNFEKDMQKIKTAMYNAASQTLPEFQEKAVLELNSIYTGQIVSTTHHIQGKN